MELSILPLLSPLTSLSLSPSLDFRSPGLPGCTPSSWWDGASNKFRRRKQQHKGPCLLLESHCSSQDWSPSSSGVQICPRFRLSWRFTSPAPMIQLWALCTRSSSFFLGSLTALLGWNRVSRSFLTNSAWEIKFFRTFMSENVFILCLVDILADNAFWARNNSAAEFWVLLPLSFSFQWCRWEVGNNPEAWFLGCTLFFLFWNL